LREYPDSGHTATNPVRDVRTAACQPACTLTAAATAGLTIPFYSLTERIGAAAVIDAARAAGIAAMWRPGTGSTAPVRYDLSQRDAALVPSPFGTDLALGSYPVTVLDQATGMATLAAGGKRGAVHFVQRVTKDYATYYAPPTVAPTNTVPALSPDVVADLTGVLSQNPAGQLAGGPASASIAGSATVGDGLLDVGHAWLVGYTPDLAMAVWIGNKEVEFPLRDRTGDRITGETLPAAIYRTVLAGATSDLGLSTAAAFPQAPNVGDPTKGDAP
jgi:membrane peptidoglycan carboxypeptidase